LIIPDIVRPLLGSLLSSFRSTRDASDDGLQVFHQWFDY
jgi:hypothetical protein